MDAMEQICSSEITHFAKLEDPRVVGRTSHRLLDIIVTTICAVISSAESWGEVPIYAEQKIDFLRRFLPLTNGTPSHDRQNISMEMYATMLFR